ncbi:MAG: Uma2 family endonuclease [Polyangiales bacterium]
MTAVARRVMTVHYPETDHMGEDALQRFIAELLRPMIARWFEAQGRRLFVGADQFFYLVEGDPTQRIAPDVYVLPGVDPDAAPPCWKRWEIPNGPSLAVEIVSRDFHKDYEDAPVDYARLDTRELVIFDPKVTPRSRVRVRWQVYRRVGSRGFRLVERSNEDWVFSKELGCFLRVVGGGPSARLRLATGERGETLVPTAAEREEAALKMVREAAQREAEAAQREAEARARIESQQSEIERLRAQLRALQRGR